MVPSSSQPSDQPESLPDLTQPGERRRIWDRQLLCALLLAVVVLVPRSMLISAAHSESDDDEYHLNRGLAFLTGKLGAREMNDPPLGEAISAFPMWLVGCRIDSPPGARGLYGYRISPETILNLIVAWKALLFVPLVGLVFLWCRRLYGLASAWLTACLVLVEPTFAAHVGLPTIDVICVEGIVMACFLAWRLLQKPTLGRSIALACATAVALMLKQTAILLPALYGVYLVIWLIRSRAGARRRVLMLLTALVAAAPVIWAMTGFDYSRPIDYMVPLPPSRHAKADPLRQFAKHRMPAGVYIGSCLHAFEHAAKGHSGYLFGQKSKKGWWYYFPVVASYKVPLGIALVIGLGLLSFIFVRFRFGEWALLVPMIAYSAWLMWAHIDIGFRHFLPPYVFMLMVASRCAAGGGVWRCLSWIGLTAAAVHGFVFHPDYLSYINFSRGVPYLAISDSNVDWGQSLKQIGKWLDEHPQNGRRVFLRYFGNDRKSVEHYLGDRVFLLHNLDAPPTDGLLIISPVRVAGVYDPQDRYAALRPFAPEARIGHSMLVYDLDRLRKRGFSWGPLKPGPPAGKVFDE